MQRTRRSNRDQIADMGLNFIEDGQPVASRREQIVSAETYLGAQGIVQALADGADIVITTRVADACCYLGPLAHELDWDFDNPDQIARGMIIGHLMECGSQVSGGYFADPGYKDVPDLHNVGNPIIEVTKDSAVISKLPGTGGLISEATCKEQLLYEVQDPNRYLCPDVIADLTQVHFEQMADNQVAVHFTNPGQPKTPTLKALVGLSEGLSQQSRPRMSRMKSCCGSPLKRLIRRRQKNCGAKLIRWPLMASAERVSGPRVRRALECNRLLG